MSNRKSSRRLCLRSHTPSDFLPLSYAQRHRPQDGAPAHTGGCGRAPRRRQPAYGGEGASTDARVLPQCQDRGTQSGPDMGKKADVKASVEKAVELFGRLDVMVRVYLFLLLLSCLLYHQLVPRAPFSHPGRTGRQVHCTLIPLRDVHFNAGTFFPSRSHRPRALSPRPPVRLCSLARAPPSPATHEVRIATWSLPHARLVQCEADVCACHAGIVHPEGNNTLSMEERGGPGATGVRAGAGTGDARVGARAGTGGARGPHRPYLTYVAPLVL